MEKDIPEILKNAAETFQNKLNEAGIKAKVVVAEMPDFKSDFKELKVDESECDCLFCTLGKSLNFDSKEQSKTENENSEEKTENNTDDKVTMTVSLDEATHSKLLTKLKQLNKDYDSPLTADELITRGIENIINFITHCEEEVKNGIGADRLSAMLSLFAILK